jgi:hypothetical protein
MRRAFGLAAAGWLALAEPAAAAVAVRAGNHPGFGRMVFDVAAGTDYSLSRDGDRVRLHFSGGAVIGTPVGIARNILSVTGGAGEVELTVVPGARVRPSRIGERVVIDVLDPAKPDPGIVATLPLPPIPPDTPPALPPTAETAAPVSADPGVAPTQPTAALAEPPAAAPQIGPVALVAAKTAPAAFSLPFGADVGAAALRRGNQALIVFDQKRPIDLTALRDDPVLATASVQLLPAATLIRLRLPEGMELALLRPSVNTWTVAMLPGPPAIRPIRPAKASKGVLLAQDAPGQVVSLADPINGVTLLLGTQRKPGQGLAVAHSTPHYALLPTWQGVAVQPLADSLSLRPAKDGFLLTGILSGIGASQAGEAESGADAVGLTRRFDFPTLSAPVMQRRLQSQVADAANALPRARGPKRLAVAQTLIALGLGAEAQSMLQLAAEEDPAMAKSPDASGLGAIAALLADRVEEARGLDDPRLSGTDEIALWRAVRSARLQKGSPQAAEIFAATLPLALTYPPGLRDRLLPLAVETMIAGGEATAAASVLATHKDDPALTLARAMSLQAEGNVEGALTAYGSAAKSPDQRQRAVAAISAVELRLAEHRIDAAGAAAALDRQLYAWRGDRNEIELRKRIAALRAEAGAWRPALALLRETKAAFPDQKTEIDAAMQAILASLLGGKAVDAIAPLEMIALLDENADLLATQQPEDTETGGVQARVAEKLLALDLPARAGPQLQRLMHAVPPGPARAGFGASLATLKLREGDAPGALAALAASVAAELPASLAEQRAVLFATASARGGQSDQALAALAPLGSSTAGELRATILEQAGNWSEAAKVLTENAAASVPPQGPLNDSQRRLLLRLASAASQAGDDPLLERLRTQELPRMAGGPLADMFRLLTAAKIQSASDLKRSGREMALARAVPAGLRAVGEPATPPAGTLPASVR